MTVRIISAECRVTVDLDNSLLLIRRHPEASVKLEVDFADSVGVLARNQRQGVSGLYS